MAKIISVTQIKSRFFITMRIFQKKGILFDIQPKRISTIRTAITETAMFIFLSPVPLHRSAVASLCHSERRSVRSSAFCANSGERRQGGQGNRRSGRRIKRCSLRGRSVGDPHGMNLNRMALMPSSTRQN